MALEKAAGSLDNEAVAAHIAANLQQCAAQLHERLAALQAAGATEEQQAPVAQQQQPEKRARRGRRASAAEVAADAAQAGVNEEEMAAAEEELARLPLLETAAGYSQLAASAAAGAPDARFSASALLLARTQPAPALVLAHVQRLAPVPPPLEEGDDDAVTARRAEALAAAAGVALGICSALACDAPAPEPALCMFAPAVGHLCEAAQMLGAAAGSDVLQQLVQLAARALASMHATLVQQQPGLAAAGRRSSGGWRANPQAPSPAEAAAEACTVAADLCFLLTTLRLHGSAGGEASGTRQRQQLEALAAAAAADLRQLAPYGTAGLLDRLAAMVSLGKLAGARTVSPGAAEPRGHAPLSCPPSCLCRSRKKRSAALAGRRAVL